MTLGAGIVPSQKEEQIIQKLTKISEDLGKESLHCSELNHYQKVYFARSISTEQFLSFGVISQKGTLGNYRKEIANNSKQYYNKCAQYLLERVGMFMRENNIPKNDLNIIFEEGNFDYSKLISLIQKCQQTPINSDVAFLQNIDPLRIFRKPKHKAPILQISDLVAHSLYKCVHKTQSNFHLPETRYLNELRHKFFHDKNTGTIIGRGIKPIHSLKQLKLDQDVENFFYNFLSKK